MRHLGWVAVLLSVSAFLSGCGESQKFRKGNPLSSRESENKSSRTADDSPRYSSEERQIEVKEKFNTEAYDHIVENDFLSAEVNPLSTFSIDVDTASYANVRRFLNQNQLPPPGAVRLEEFINYFKYSYPQPKNNVPFAVHTEVADCPWNPSHRLVRIGLKGREIQFDKRPASNLVFLLDVSGSMRDSNKLPLVKSAMKLLVEQLDENDRVAIVVYAGASGLALPSTTGNQKEIILSAFDQLQAGGSTNGAQGIQLAYEIAMNHFVEGGINRVILCTDGDFNVGISDRSRLVNLIQQKAKSNIFLSLLGFGQGNYKDSAMEQLADKGNGNYAYIDSLKEAKKVLVEQATSTLITIAKDVKIQVDFNPQKVAAYRLIGYENRMLQAKDFLDDKKDAGEIGAGHTVTALYEIVPPGVKSPVTTVKPSKYKKTKPFQKVETDELLTVRLRYKEPDANESTGFEVSLIDKNKSFENASKDFQFAASVAEFGMLLRNSKYKGKASFENVHSVATINQGNDPHGYRKEFIQLIEKATKLSSQQHPANAN